MTPPSLRTAIVGAARQLAPLGLATGVSGNISVRDGTAMLITPTATPYDAMAPEDIVRMPLEGPDGAQRPSSEWRFHAALLRNRPEFGALIHAHPPHATALSMLRRPIPAAHYMVAVFGGEDVRCAPYAGFGSAELAVHAVAAMADRSACLLANHGMIAAAATLDRAMWLAVELETLARQYLLACSVGDPVLLTADEMADARARIAGYGLSG